MLTVLLAIDSQSHWLVYCCSSLYCQHEYLSQNKFVLHCVCLQSTRATIITFNFVDSYRLLTLFNDLQV